jgi:AraC-like DNA-binding protein
MSASVLKTSFHEVFGVTVFAYLRNLRLERAREMLLDQGVSVKEVSWAVGYASLSHFARAFRQRFGVSPHAWARPRSFS